MPLQSRPFFVGIYNVHDKVAICTSNRWKYMSNLFEIVPNNLLKYFVKLKICIPYTFKSLTTFINQLEVFWETK